MALRKAAQKNNLQAVGYLLQYGIRNADFVFDCFRDSVRRRQPQQQVSVMLLLAHTALEGDTAQARYVMHCFCHSVKLKGLDFCQLMMKESAPFTHPRPKSLRKPTLNARARAHTHTHTHTHTHARTHAHTLTHMRCACCCLLEASSVSLIVLAIRLALFFIVTHTHTLRYMSKNQLH